MHSIIIYPRNATTDQPHFILEPAGYETFNRALGEMGKDRDEINRLSSASGRSLTVLRRQLSSVPAVRTPEWASDPQTAAKLIPFLFVGACGNNFHWCWEEAFDKFGFGDGDGQVMTEHIVHKLEAAGYAVTSETWGLHNTIITRIAKDGQQLMRHDFYVGTPPTVVYALDECICWPNGDPRQATTTIAKQRYCWMIWKPGFSGPTRLAWLTTQAQP